MPYTISQLARLANISVRTLHYYDEIGLLKPSLVAKNGYRYYEQDELLRLQQILFFRELDFPLDEIKRIINNPAADKTQILRDQKNLLRLKRNRLDRLMKTIDKTIKTMNNEQAMNGEELYDPFKDDDVKQYQEEAKQRWGNTDAYKQSMERVSKMTKNEREQLKKDGEAHTQAIADNMEKGIEHPDVQALIGKSHEGSNFFYDCDVKMFRNLGEMDVGDPRFTAYYEKFKPGVAQFMKDANAYYCHHHQKQS